MRGSTINHVCIFLIIGLLQINLINALISVELPVSEYWGVNDDAELQLQANVTFDGDWTNVAVVVTTPDNRTLPATTTDGSVSTSKLYIYAIKELFIADAGIYTFSVEDSLSGDTDEASATVYIYTIDVLPTVASHHVVDGQNRAKPLLIPVSISTDGNWDDIIVKAASPSGTALTSSHVETGFPFWRIYRVNVDDAEAGLYNITATETLGGEGYTMMSTSSVEVHAATTPDEYLYRISENTDSLTASISEFYQYWYDGPDDTYILDGGSDMYDRGNYLTISSDTAVTENVPYGKPITSSSYVFSSKTTFPFTSLMWVSNEDKSEDMFSIRVNGKTGTFGTGETSQISVALYHSSYTMWYKTFQVFGASDPSICEVYFYITNNELWSSVNPNASSLSVGGAPTGSLDNTFTVNGQPQNIMLGYVLLSRESGNETSIAEVNSSMHQIMNLIEEKDAFTLTAVEDSIELEQSETSTTLSVRVTTVGDWADHGLTLHTPEHQVYTVTEFTDGGDNTRIYTYDLNSLTEADSGIYTFHATDKYGYTLMSQTKLIVFSAEVIITTSEYWGVAGDPELVLSIDMNSNNWTNSQVFVTRPDGSVQEAEAQNTTGDIRTFNHVVKNLFSEDAGLYQFTAYRNGLVSSRPGNVTVYLFSVGIQPESSTSNTINRETKAMIMVYVTCDGDWGNVKGYVTSPTNDEFDMYTEEGPLPYIRAFIAVANVAAGEYNIRITETQGTRSASKFATETIEVYNSTHVDEYLYRIGLVSDEITDSISGWKDYWYDGVDNTYISDGGFDMYDRGNYISYGWSSGSETNVPYGKPFEYNSFHFSSKAIYPFVTMMWIDNSDRNQSEFSITVEGRAGAGFDSVINRYERILFEGTYDVTYHVFHLNGTSDPSICEVYFLISNLYEWKSVLPVSFDLTVGGEMISAIENTARITGFPSNVMFGYTLLSKENGAEVTYLDVEKALEKYVDIIAERDQFGITITSEDGNYVSKAGENAVVQATVSTSGKWDGINVEVTTPSGQTKPVTDYTLDPLHTRRIFEYRITDSEASDIGEYSFFVTDKYDGVEETMGYLHVFTTKVLDSETQYVGDPAQPDPVVMEIFVRTENTNLGMLNVEIDTPKLGTQQVTDRTIDSDNLITFRYKIESPTFEQDNGEYTFRVYENFETYSDESTWTVNLEVFQSISSTVPEPSYTADPGAETLQIVGVISTSGNWDAVSVEIITPGRGTPGVENYEETELASTRRYIYTMRDVTADDTGAYIFVTTETLNGVPKQTESEPIEVIVKEEKLNGGEIAGIVIGSVAGAAILIGLLVYCCKKGEKQTEKSSMPLSDDVVVPEKKKIEPESPKKKEGSEKKKEDDSVTAL